MKILITGATGFLGRALGGALSAQGHELVVLTRNPEKIRVKPPFPCAVHAWNPEEAAVDSKAFERLDAVVHLAGEPVAGRYWTQKKKRKIYDFRILSTRYLVDGLMRTGSKKPGIFLSASAKWPKASCWPANASCRGLRWNADFLAVIRIWLKHSALFSTGEQSYLDFVTY